MSELKDSLNQSNHSYGDNESSSDSKSAASSRQEPDNAGTLGGPSRIRKPSSKATRPKKKSPPKKKGSVPMTPNDLVDLRRRCQAPPEVNMILPRSLLSPENVPEGWRCAYANFFTKCGLFFPIPVCILEMLYCLGLAFPQMCPNFVRHVLALFTRARELNREFG